MSIFPSPLKTHHPLGDREGRASTDAKEQWTKMKSLSAEHSHKYFRSAFPSIEVNNNMYYIDSQEDQICLRSLVGSQF